MRNSKFVAVVAVVAALVVVGCGDDDDATSTPTSSSTSVETSSTTSSPDSTDQAAMWPAPTDVLATPQAAAEKFVTEVFGVPAALGDFQAGDSRSGEIEVFAPGEDGAATSIVRGVLFVRQLGPSDGWYVIGAGNDNATISEPAPLSEVTAGPITVAGVARGFEAAVTVSAYIAGSPDPLDEVQTLAGAMETPEPYDVTLDLSGAAPGDRIALVVRGGTGLETDPGDFGGIVVVIES